MPSVATNWDGSAPTKIDKPLIAEDVYEGAIAGIRLIEAKAYDSTDMEFNLVYDVVLPEVAWTKTNDDGSTEETKGANLALWVKPKITKGSGTFSNSKLFDLLEKGKLLEIAKAETEKFSDEIKGLDNLLEFLIKNFEGRKGKFIVKTRNKGKDNAYSSIKEVVNFK